MLKVLSPTDLADPRRVDPSAEGWAKRIRSYARADDARALMELAITAIPFAGFWVLAAVLLPYGYGYSLLACFGAALCLTRLFVIQHDCGHRSFFQNRLANDLVGGLIGILTFTPYRMWRRNHSVHHATSGNLDRRRDSDIRTLTLAEYAALSPLRRLGYRLYRHPFTIFVLGPIWVFQLKYRLPIDIRRATRDDWISVLRTNAAILALIFGIGAFIGPLNVFLIHAPIIQITAMIGIWLFYVQHQFEQTTWDEAETWNLQEAALFGSSHYDLPKPLAWLTGSIGVHHVHHLNSKIPFYRLSEVLGDHPALARISRVGFTEAFSTTRLHIWDDANRRLISFAEAHRNLRG